MSSNKSVGTQYQSQAQAQPSQPQGQPQMGQNQAADADLLSQALDGATSLPVPVGGGGYGLAIERGGSFNLMDFVFNNAAARRHMGVIDYTNSVFDETGHGMELSAALILSCANNCIENEAAMEQVILRHSNSKMALTSAPLYIQLARQMQLQHLPEITQNGVNLIKQKLERR